MLQSIRFKALRFGARLLRSPFARVLAPFSWVWAFGVHMRSWRAAARVSVPVVSVGNLSLGGTGKTPLVILLAQQFPERRIAVLARGYGARPGEWSDEMRVIRRHVPGATLYQGADRVALAKQAVRDGAELILLDDGFQYRRLHRDADLVVVRPEDVLLREPLSALKRARLVVSYAPTPLAAVRLGVRTQAPHFHGERVGLFAGIGNPERFRPTVEELGAVVVGELLLADHEPVSAERLAKFAKRLDVNTLVCTEKDFVKLPAGAPPVIPIPIEAYVLEGHAAWQKFIAEIGQKLDNYSPYEPQRHHHSS